MPGAGTGASAGRVWPIFAVVSALPSP